MNKVKRLLLLLPLLFLFGICGISQGIDTSSVIVKSAVQYVGIPYKWGGTTTSGFDCSGFTQYVYNKNGITLNRTANNQYKQAEKIKKEQIKPGDLVFFKGRKSKMISHVGIAISTYVNGSFNFIHSRNRGVGIDNSKMTYYDLRYVGAARVL